MSEAWQITGWYIMMLVVVAVLAKIASLRRAGIRKATDMIVGSFFWAPSLSIRSWQKRERITGAQGRMAVLTTAVQLVFLVLVYIWFVPAVCHYVWWLQSYLVVVPFWLLLESLNGLCRVLWLFTGRLVPPINIRPWQAEHLADFWGHRWNRLVSDWLRQVVFVPLQRRPQRALFCTFLVSGLLHELLVSVPMAIVYHQSVWGWFVGYFLFQYLAMRIERRLGLSRFGRRILLWLVVLGPVPLVLNRATLLIFHLGG